MIRRHLIIISLAAALVLCTALPAAADPFLTGQEGINTGVFGMTDLANYGVGFAAGNLEVSLAFSEDGSLWLNESISYGNNGLYFHVESGFTPDFSESEVSFGLFYCLSVGKSLFFAAGLGCFPVEMILASGFGESPFVVPFYIEAQALARSGLLFAYFNYTYLTPTSMSSPQGFLELGLGIAF